MIPFVSFTLLCVLCKLFCFLHVLHSHIVSIMFAFLNVDYYYSVVILCVYMFFVSVAFTVSVVILSVTYLAYWFFNDSMLNVLKSKTMCLNSNMQMGKK